MIIMKPQNVMFLLVIFTSLGLSKEIEDDYSKLWEALHEMKYELADTKNELAETKNELAETKNELTETKNELAETKHELVETKHELAGTKRRLAETENKLTETIDGVRTVKEKCEVKDVSKKGIIPPSADINSMEHDIITLKAQVQSLAVPKVGFTAILSHDISNLGDNQIIVFDQVITNIGGSYNSYSGIFICKEPGLYLFYVHTLAEPGKHVETVIRKNSQNMAYTYALDREAFSSGSNMAIMNLNVGDTVYVQSFEHKHDSSGAIIDFRYTSFSGVLIQN